MYGAEFWSLNSTLLSKLESFQAQLGKRILKLPKYTANNIPLLALQWPSMRCSCFCAKRTFLHRVWSDGDLQNQLFTCLAASDVESINLVKQCHFLEWPYGTNFTDNILNDNDLSMRSLKTTFADRGCPVENCTYTYSWQIPLWVNIFSAHILPSPQTFIH